MNNTQDSRHGSEIDPATTLTRQKVFRAIECVLLFIGVPSAYFLGWLPIPVILLLLVMAGGCWFALRLRKRITLRDLTRMNAPACEWRRIIWAYALAFLLLAGLLWLTKPGALFTLIRHRPMVWLLVMFAYPLISVFPQEFVYRVFFFDRYRPLFGQGDGIIIVSAAVFAYGHIVFHNWPSVVLTFLGGWLFARTYQRTASVVLVATEHALYGWAIFTIGYGEFFLEGTMRIFRQ